MEEKKYGVKGTKMQGHTVIIGFNKFSASVINEILAAEKQVVVVSNSKADLDLLAEKYENSKLLFKFLCDYTNYDKLEKINIGEANCVFVSFLEDSDSLVHILNLQSKYEGLNIIVNLNKPFLRDTFKSATAIRSADIVPPPFTITSEPISAA